MLLQVRADAKRSEPAAMIRDAALSHSVQLAGIVTVKLEMVTA
jgi:hypothetical protein